MPDASGHARLTCQNRGCFAIVPRHAKAWVLPWRKPLYAMQDATLPGEKRFQIQLSNSMSVALAKALSVLAPL